MEHSDAKKIKILFLFVVVLLGFVIFLGTLFYWATIDRRLPRLDHKEVNHALRGNIISADGFRLATSQKLYRASVDTRNIDPKKFDLFVKLVAFFQVRKPYDQQQRHDRNRSKNVQYRYLFVRDKNTDHDRHS